MGGSGSGAPGSLLQILSETAGMHPEEIKSSLFVVTHSTHSSCDERVGHKVVISAKQIEAAQIFPIESSLHPEEKISASFSATHDRHAS